MNVLVAITDHTDTHADSRDIDDYNYLTDGEYVTSPSFVCCNADSNCGCGRAWSGTTSHKAGTMAVIAARDIDVAAYTALIHESLKEVMGGLCTDGELADDAAYEAEDLLAAAALFPVGTVVTRWCLGNDNDPSGSYPVQYRTRGTVAP